MSISAEYAEEHKSSPAVLCCRAEEGVVLSSHNLEDPEIFDDLVDQGLLKLDGCLTIGDVLGAKLLKTCDSLTPLTKDLVELADKPAEASKVEEAAAAPAVAAVAAPVGAVAATGLGGSLKIHIGEGKGIDIQIPVGALGGASGVPV
ncbi:MAG: D-proline reductase (dithiol) proprotein PrdA, partial [Oribacterium sinus]|nr:D-proline reductase (dithiol) proprotein PrdA [Oribacterium sinus]